MRVLCLDLSLHCGYAFFDSPVDDTIPKLVKYGTIHFDGPSVKERDSYPWSYVTVAEEHVNSLKNLWEENDPEVVVIEETNKGKNRYSQKMLEFLHHELLRKLMMEAVKVIYFDTSHWRSVLGIWMTKEQKKINAKINKAKRESGDSGARAMKKKLGVKGKTNKKHIAIAHVNQVFNLKLKVKDNDAADAICLGLAYFKGAVPSDGT
jgi:Holliday junction resolvasome RuvABC endonuclease subunit